MCYLDLEPCDLWSEIERTARTNKMCSSCDGAINKGDRYIKHFSKYDGFVTSNNLCKSCEHDRDEFAMAHEHMNPTPDNFWNLLSDCVSEDEDDKWKAMLDRMRARKSVKPVN